MADWFRIADQNFAGWYRQMLESVHMVAFSIRKHHIANQATKLKFDGWHRMHIAVLYTLSGQARSAQV